MNDLMKYINEYAGIVDSIWGTYLDATTGFDKVKDMIIEGQSKHRFDESHLDTLNFYYGKGKPGEPGARQLHACTQGRIKQRNSEGGDNFRFIGNMSLISIYQYWEDYYRGKIAQQKGIEKNKLLSDIMGDIRYIRRSIIHHQGIALSDVEKCKLLKWYSVNDEIYISQDQLEEIISHIFDMLDKLAN
ncbi:MAG: hypothetical protein ACLTBU_16895 [Zhenhengia sp.]|uniref:hypothetical protein n=1 Tax=Zhenhengia sp. TaxID=2944208 RepID=UPI0039966379